MLSTEAMKTFKQLVSNYKNNYRYKFYQKIELKKMEIFSLVAMISSILAFVASILMFRQDKTDYVLSNILMLQMGAIFLMIGAIGLLMAVVVNYNHLFMYFRKFYRKYILYYVSSVKYWYMVKTMNSFNEKLVKHYPEIHDTLTQFMYTEDIKTIVDGLQIKNVKLYSEDEIDGQIYAIFDRLKSLKKVQKVYDTPSYDELMSFLKNRGSESQNSDNYSFFEKNK